MNNQVEPDTELSDMQWAQRQGIRQARESIRTLLETALQVRGPELTPGLSEAIRIINQLEENH